MKTAAAILVALKEPLQIVELEIPPLQRGQVLIEIAYSGLCHSQLNEWKGKKGEDPYLPHTLGHEGSGVVLEVGQGVTKVKPGDSVVLSWIKGQGMDVPSTVYRWGDKKVNSGAISTFMEKAIISENRLIPIPSEISLREAALLGCAIPTGAGVVLNEMRVEEGKSVAVFGMGGIGLSALLAARSLKAFPIVAIDVREEKLQFAKKMGATHALNAKETNFLPKLLEISKQKGFDFSLECAGNKQAMELAFSSVRASGGLAVLAGNLAKGEKIEIDPFDLIKGKKIVGTWGGSTCLDRDMSRYIDLFFKEKAFLSPLISHEVSLHKINELMQWLDAGKMARGLISFKR